MGVNSWPFVVQKTQKMMMRSMAAVVHLSLLTSDVSPRPPHGLPPAAAFTFAA